MLTILALAVEIAHHDARWNEGFAEAVGDERDTTFWMIVWPAAGLDRQVVAWGAARLLHTVEMWT